MYIAKKILQEITWCCQNAVWCRCYLIALSRQVFPPVALPHSSVLLLKSFKVQSPGIHAALAHLLFKVNITLCSIVLLFTGDLLQWRFSSIYRLQRNNNWLYIKCLQMQSLWYTNYTKYVCLVFFFLNSVLLPLETAYQTCSAEGNRFHKRLWNQPKDQIRICWMTPLKISSLKWSFAKKVHNHILQWHCSQRGPTKSFWKLTGGSKIPVEINTFSKGDFSACRDKGKVWG